MSTESDIAPGRRRPSTNLAHDLVSDLTQQIMRGLLKPGDKLPSESTIVRAHGVSRTVVREAISKLQAAGWWKPTMASAASCWNARTPTACA